MSIVIYLCINMRKERFQVRISSNGFSETFFSLFIFHFSIFSFPRQPFFHFSIFTFQFYLFPRRTLFSIFNFFFLIFKSAIMASANITFEYPQGRNLIPLKIMASCRLTYTPIYNSRNFISSNTLSVFLFNPTHIYNSRNFISSNTFQHRPFA